MSETTAQRIRRAKEEAEKEARREPGKRKPIAGVPGVYVRVARDGSPTYYAKVTEQRTRKNVWLRGPSFNEAVTLRAEKYAEAKRGKVIARPARVMFADFAEEHYATMEGRKRRGTLVLHRQALDTRLIPKFGTCYVSEITTDAVAAFVSELLRAGKVIRYGGKEIGREGLSPHTVRNTLGVLSAIMARAVRKGLIPANPVAGLSSDERPPGETKPYPRLEAADLAAFLDAVPQRWRTLIVTALSTGLRQSELLGLRWRDVDHEAGELHVRQAHGRHDEELKSGNARRTLVLHPETAQLLATLSLDTRHDGGDDYVFCTADGQPLGHRDAQRVVEKAREKSGLNAKCELQGARRFTFHGLRHAYGSLRLAAGESLADVSRDMGHAQLAITDRTYGHVIEERKRLERARANQERTFEGVLVTGSIAGAEEEQT